MNVNKECNKIQREIKKTVEERLVKCLDNLEIEVEKINQQFFGELDTMINRLFEYTEEERDIAYEVHLIVKKMNEETSQYKDIVMKTAEDSIRGVAQGFNAITYDRLVAYLVMLGIDEHRIQLEYKRLSHSVTKMFTRFVNMNMKEIEVAYDNKIRHYRDMLLIIEDRLEEVEVEIETEVEVEVKKEKVLRITNRRELEELVEAQGFEFQRQSGSHKVYANEFGNITVIPNHGKTVSTGVAYSVQKQTKKK